MKKTIFITNIIKAVFILTILIFVLVNNKLLEAKLMIVVFMLLTICYIAKNICGLLNKPNGVKIFQKLFIIIFLLFGSVFLIVWSYVCIKEKSYFSVLFTIPFWLVEYYIFRKSFLNNNKDSKKIKKKTTLDFQITVSVFLVLCVLISGIFCLVIGIKDTIKTSKKTKNYLTTTSYFKDYEIYDTKEKDTYRLIYTYTVDGKEYTIKTDYGSGTIPSVNSQRQLKYNPSNPSEAIFTGTNRNSGLIYFGAFFILGSMIFILIFLSSLGVFNKIKFDIIGAYIGIVFLIIGIGIITFQMGETSSLIEAIKRMGFWTLIPLMFIVVGIIQTIKSLFFTKEK